MTPIRDRSNEEGGDVDRERERERERERKDVHRRVVAVDNEATDARSYLPIRNENEGEIERESLSQL